MIDTLTLATKGSLWITRPAMMDYIRPRAHMLDMAKELFDLVLAGKITSEPRQVFSLAQAADAHRALASRSTSGATVLVP
jgi:NADPH2:quinone reductase